MHMSVHGCCVCSQTPAEAASARMHFLLLCFRWSETPTPLDPNTHRGRAVAGFAFVSHAPSWARGLHLRMNTNGRGNSAGCRRLGAFQCLPFAPITHASLALPDISVLAHVPKFIHLTVGINVFHLVKNLQNAGRCVTEDKQDGGLTQEC